MKRPILTIIFVSAVISLFTCQVFANKVEPGQQIKGGKFGVVYECAFPNTVKLDGNLEDQAWALAPWHFVDNITGTGPAPNEADASYAFAAVADEKWLYVAFKIKDDKIKKGEQVGNNVWQDDSVEIYIDPNHGETDIYEKKDGKWDSQITIGADNIGGKVQAPLLGGSGEGPGTGTCAAVVKAAGGWIVEAGVPLNSPKKWNMVPKDGMVIGFNTHFNDDDDGGGRDHKLIWSAKDVDDQSWQNTSRFADLKFVRIELSVASKGKLAIQWGHLKEKL